MIMRRIRKYPVQIWQFIGSVELLGYVWVIIVKFMST